MRILELRTDSHSGSLGDARRWVRDTMARAGLGIDAARDMEVAVGEALSNVCQHAYTGGVGPVFVEVLTSSHDITVVVRDEGMVTAAPVIPRTLPPRTNTGGRGLYMIGRLVDDVAMHVPPGGHGLTVKLTARLEAPLPPSPSGARSDA